MKPTTLPNKLSKEFYFEDPVVLAPKLLGKIFVRKSGVKTLSGRIVEVEAYRGKDDPAAHSFRGKTKRNEIMFREGGYLYVYFTYGVHFCANIVAGKKDEGCAVLLRAVEPVDGIDLMALNRFGKKNLSQKEKLNLTSGPAKICYSFSIARKENGSDLSGNSIFLLDSSEIPASKIVRTTRIGIKKAADYPWRFYIDNNPYVSKK